MITENQSLLNIAWGPNNFTLDMAIDEAKKFIAFHELTRDDVKIIRQSDYLLQVVSLRPVPLKPNYSAWRKENGG